MRQVTSFENAGLNGCGVVVAAPFQAWPTILALSDLSGRKSLLAAPQAKTQQSAADETEGSWLGGRRRWWLASGERCTSGRIERTRGGIRRSGRSHRGRWAHREGRIRGHASIIRCGRSWCRTSLEGGEGKSGILGQAT